MLQEKNSPWSRSPGFLYWSLPVSSMQTSTLWTFHFPQGLHCIQWPHKTRFHITSECIQWMCLGPARLLLVLYFRIYIHFWDHTTSNTYGMVSSLLLITYVVIVALSLLLCSPDFWISPLKKMVPLLSAFTPDKELMKFSSWHIFLSQSPKWQFCCLPAEGIVDILFTFRSLSCRRSCYVGILINVSCQTL